VRTAHCALVLVLVLLCLLNSNSKAGPFDEGAGARCPGFWLQLQRQLIYTLRQFKEKHFFTFWHPNQTKIENGGRDAARAPARSSLDARW
jgi:hypothetical protein